MFKKLKLSIKIPAIILLMALSAALVTGYRAIRESSEGMLLSSMEKYEALGAS